MFLQFGIWASWSCWVGLTVCTMCKLCYYHQMSNMKASMLRERQKLIDEGMAAPTRVTPYNTQTNISSGDGNNSKIESQKSESTIPQHQYVLFVVHCDYSIKNHLFERMLYLTGNIAKSCI